MKGIAVRSNGPFSCHQAGHQHCVAEALQQAEKICREKHLRLTPIRRRVLELIWENHRPVGAYQLLDMLQRHGSTAPPTVYRALDFLQQHGLVHRVSSMNAYIGCSHAGKPHVGQFLICTECHSLAELDDSQVNESIRTSARLAGFEVHQQIVEVSGLCPQCWQEQQNG